MFVFIQFEGFHIDDKRYSNSVDLYAWNLIVIYLNARGNEKAYHAKLLQIPH